MRRLFGCPDIVSLTEKFLMARNLWGTAKPFKSNSLNNMLNSQNHFELNVKSQKWLSFKCNVHHKKCFLSLIKIDRKSRSCLLYFIISVLLCYHTVTIICPSKPWLQICKTYMYFWEFSVQM